jgi:hypothetical protein
LYHGGFAIAHGKAACVFCGHGRRERMPALSPRCPTEGVTPMKEHEADIIKLLAALTAAPRWVTALVVADGAAFTWGDAPLWSILSAVLSVLFAGVETYAAAYIMRAWRQSKPGSQAECALLALWLVTLAVLVVVMTPPIYANTTHTAFDTLPGAVLLAWSICVAASTFLVVGGVGYAEKTRTLRATASDAASEAERRSSDALATNTSLACDVCGATFANRFALSGHMRAHKNGHDVDSVSEAARAGR